MNFNWMRRLGIGLLCATFLIATQWIAHPGLAQTTSGTIVGTLTDSAGGVIPRTQIALINVATSTKLETTTDESGYYQFFNVPPAEYRLLVQKSGFRQLSEGPFKLEVEGSLRINLQMQVGSQNETVTVTAESPLIQAENTSLGSVIDERQTIELPLNGRNPMALAALVPSVVPQAGSNGNTNGQNPFAWGNYQIGGGMANQSLTYIDGAPVNTAYLNLTSLIPTQDSLAEFKVDTNDLTADYGHLAGGAIQFSTKSGSNHLHGAAWEYIRNKVFDANSWNLNNAGKPKGAFTQNQFGLNLGGPVYIPHLYDGHNKTFFFFNWEGFYTRQGASSIQTVPTEAEIEGNMNLLPTGNNADGTTSAPTIYDPLTTCTNLSGCAGDPTKGLHYGDRLPFKDNIIPSNRINPVAQAYIKKFYPVGKVGSNNSVGNYTSAYSNGGQNFQTVAKIDHQVSEKQQISSRFTAWTNVNLPIDPLGTGICQDRCQENFTTYNWVGGDTYTFNSRTILDLRVSYLRFIYSRAAKNVTYQPSDIGQTIGGGGKIEFPGPPTVSIDKFDQSGTFGSNGADSTIGDYSDNDRISGNLTKIAGKHTFKLGGEWLRMTFNYFQANNSSGEANVHGDFTQDNHNKPTQNTGAGLATFLLGYVTDNGMQYLNVNKVASELLYPAVYVTDDWRITNKFTAHLGLRWENNLPWTDRQNNISYFDPNQVNPILTAAGLSGYKGSAEVVSSSTRSSRRAQDTFGAQFSPRVGLSYAMTPATVISAGYGVLWLPIEVSFQSSPNNDSINSFTTSSIVSTDGNNTPAPTNNFGNPIPGGMIAPPGRSSDPVHGFQYVLLGTGPGMSFPNNPYAYAQQWNFGIQRQFGPAMVGDIAYAGNKGTHLPFYNLNQTALPDKYFNTDASNLNLIQEQVPNPFYGVINPNYGLGSSATIQNKTLLSPYPQYSGLGMGAANWANSDYHSLQAKFQKRFTGGASIGAGYTFAKLISSTDTLTAWLGENVSDIWGVTDPNRLNLEKSVSSQNVTHRLVVNYVYDIPVGRGKAILPDANRFADEVVGGWGVEGVTTFQSGYPVSIGSPSNYNQVFGYGGQRAAVVAGCDRAKKTSGPITSKLWFNPACYTQAPELTFGESRNDPIVHAPGIDNWDASVFKNFSMDKDGRTSIQFRAEFFNVWNRVQFAGPDTGLSNSTVGKVTGGQANSPRLVQFALRIRY